MKNLKLTSKFVALSFVAVLFTILSCKEPLDTIAKIHVRDADNNVVSGAVVALYGEPTDEGQTQSNVADTVESNAAGEAIFNLNDLYKAGQAGVAVLNISVSKNLGQGNGFATGEGIIKIEAEETSEETVFIQ